MHPTVIGPHPFRTDIGVVIQTITHDLLGDLRDDVIHIRIIGAEHSHPIERQALEEVHEGLFQFAEVMAIGFHMIGIDVCHHRNHGRQAQEGGIRLIGLSHQKLPFTQARIGTGGIQTAPDDKGRIEATLSQNRGNQTRCRGLAMRPGNGNALLQTHQFSQHLGSWHDGDSGFTGSDDFRVI